MYNLGKIIPLEFPVQYLFMKINLENTGQCIYFSTKSLRRILFLQISNLTGV